MRIMYYGNNKKINTSIVTLNSILEDGVLVHNALDKYVGFDYSLNTRNSKITGLELYNLFYENRVIAEVRDYYNIFGIAYGYVDKSFPKLIMLNRKFIGKRSVASIVGSIAHEYVHVLDNYLAESFGHGDNKSKGKENTAPYAFGREIKQIALRS